MPWRRAAGELRARAYHRAMGEEIDSGGAGLRSGRPSARLFVSLVMTYVQRAQSELAWAAIRAGVQADEREELLARLEGMEGEAAEVARQALEKSR